MVHAWFDIQRDIGGVGCIHTCLRSQVVETGIFILDLRIVFPPPWLASCDNGTSLGPLDQNIDKTIDHSYGCIIFVCRNLDNL